MAKGLWGPPIGSAGAGIEEDGAAKMALTAGRPPAHNRGH